MDKKTQIKNLYYARKAVDLCENNDNGLTEYQTYIHLGGTGSCVDFINLMSINRLKAEKRESLLKEVYGS